MRKTDKIIDNTLRKTLTEVCDFAQLHCEGYQWITHTVNYKNFPDSLMITCMFDNQQNSDQEKQQGELVALINKQLNAMSVNLKKPLKQICFKHA